LWTRAQVLGLAAPEPGGPSGPVVTGEVVRFAQLIDRPVGEPGGPAARAACGGNLSLPQWPLKVILTLRTAPIDACAQAVVTA
jgi:hypothetical protein